MDARIARALRSSLRRRRTAQPTSILLQSCIIHDIVVYIRHNSTTDLNSDSLEGEKLLVKRLSIVDAAVLTNASDVSVVHRRGAGEDVC